MIKKFSFRLSNRDEKAQQMKKVSSRMNRGSRETSLDLEDELEPVLRVEICDQFDENSETYNVTNGVSLRQRLSSVNSEVTIHDVRRCTITEVPEEVRKWIVSTFSRQEQDESERKKGKISETRQSCQYASQASKDVF